jgi:hypothetical protein
VYGVVGERFFKDIQHQSDALPGQGLYQVVENLKLAIHFIEAKPVFRIQKPTGRVLTERVAASGLSMSCLLLQAA